MDSKGECKINLMTAVAVRKIDEASSEPINHAIPFGRWCDLKECFLGKLVRCAICDGDFLGDLSWKFIVLKMIYELMLFSFIMCA